MMKALYFFVCFIQVVFSAVERPGKVFEAQATSSIGKMNYYDNNGILTLNGSVPGVSKAIMLDFKQYYVSCGSNVYFSFMFTANPGKGHICREGITFCYEGQLMPEYVMPGFQVPNQPGSVIYNQCFLANEGAKYVRALNVGTRTFVMRHSSDVVGATFDIPNSTLGQFFVISTSFTKEEYFLPMPEDRTIVLQIGESKKLSTKVLNTEGEEIWPVQFKTANKSEFGRAATNFGEPPDTENMERLADSLGLWMLYMDFKTQPQAWQVFNTIHPKRCGLTVKVRGNRMSPCRTFWQDLLVTEPMPVPFDLTYTQEVGTVQKNEIGREESSEIMSSFKEAQKELEVMKHAKETSNEQATSQEQTNINRNMTMKENIKTQTNGFEGSVKLNVIPDPAGDAAKKIGNQVSDITGSDIAEDVAGAAKKPIDVSVTAGGKVKNVQSQSTKETWIHEEKNTNRKTNRMFSGTTRSKALMESFKNSHGASSTMTSSTLMSATMAFSTRESVDITVQNISPGQKLIIRQLFFECDGNVVKLPFIELTDGVENIEVKKAWKSSENVFEEPALNWNNQTSGMARDGIFLTNHQVAYQNPSTTAKQKSLRSNNSKVSIERTESKSLPAVEPKSLDKGKDDKDLYEDILNVDQG